MVEIEHSAETRPAPDRAESGIVVARCRLRLGELATDPLMISLGLVVLDELLDQVAQVALPDVATGLIQLLLPVRCDQTGPANVTLVFAVGSPSAPAGLYAAASRRPDGSAAIVDAWGEALVAFSWHCLLDLVTGIAAATGKDQRGNLLVPVELPSRRKGSRSYPCAPSFRGLELARGAQVRRGAGETMSTPTMALYWTALGCAARRLHHRMLPRGYLPSRKR